MRKLLSGTALALFSIFLMLGDVAAQGTKPGTKPGQSAATPPVKSYGSGTKKEDPPKAEPSKPEPKKTYGSGTKPAEEPKKEEPKKSYGSGSGPAVDPKTGKQVTPPATGPPSAGTKPGTAPPTTPKVTPPVADPSVGTKPGATTKYDGAAAAAQKKEESKQKYIQAQKPAPTYTDPKGQVHKLDEKDVQIQRLRRELSAERYANRDLRERQFYSVYVTRPVVVYHDSYNPFFWYWLMDRSVEQQALWAYHHRQSMDQARYNEMLAKNAELAARVRALEAQGVARDAAYVPPGMSDRDLMYNKEYVQAAGNFQPAPQPPPQTNSSGGGSALTYFLVTVIIVLVLILLTWLVFLKRWN